MIDSFPGKTALITGAGNGIGRGTALALARRGAKVACVDIAAAALAKTVAEIAAAGGEALAYTVDVGEGDCFTMLAEEIGEKWGAVDILMNNVGVLLRGRPEDIPIGEWERLFNVNFLSAVRAVQTFTPAMIARGYGHVINTASFAGLFPYAYDRLPYAATKAAMVSFTEGLYLYLKPQGLGVTLLCPGPVITEIGKTMRTFTEGLPLRGPGLQFPALNADDVGEMVAEAILADRFFLPTDEQVGEILRKRADDPGAFLQDTLASWN